MNSIFQAFGIRVKYPDRFRIYINQRHSFTDKDGIVKFDDTVGTQEGRTSLTVSWEEAGDQQDFGKQYLEHVEAHYDKKVKRRYKILERCLIDAGGHEAAFLHTRLLTQTHVFKPMGKSLQLQVMQTARYCEKTHRIIIATIMAERGYFEMHTDTLKEILLAVECHSDIDAGDQDQRIDSYLT